MAMPSSPRLPSPPPAAEIMIGPKSPAMGGASLAQQQMDQQMEQTILDANAKRRIHPGTRAADFAAGPPLVPLNELDSAFQLQEHLAALHYHHSASNTRAITRETAALLAQAPAGTDRTLWLYELCRFLIAQCNSLIIGFLFDSPPCSAATCPEMRASEWQFLCAVHEQPRSCCAIDYCCHTLDWAANVVTNPKIFPSRFAFADQHDKNAATKSLVNVFRRLHRIFAHSWFQHREVFWTVEGQTGLYVLFKTVCDLYELLPAENYKLPPEAEGLAVPGANEPAAVDAAGSGAGAFSDTTPGLISVSSIPDRRVFDFHRGPGGPGGPGGLGGGLAADLVSGEHSLGRNNTRRHIRSSPSTGSAVTTVLEQEEDGGPPPAFLQSRLRTFDLSHRPARGPVKEDAKPMVQPEPVAEVPAEKTEKTETEKTEAHEAETPTGPEAKEPEPEPTEASADEKPDVAPLEVEALPSEAETAGAETVAEAESDVPQVETVETAEAEVEAEAEAVDVGTTPAEETPAKETPASAATEPAPESTEPAPTPEEPTADESRSEAENTDAEASTEESTAATAGEKPKKKKKKKNKGKKKDAEPAAEAKPEAESA